MRRLFIYYDGIISKDTILSKKKKNKQQWEQNSVYSIPSKSTCICVLKRGENEVCGREEKTYIIAQYMSRGMPKKQSIYCLKKENWVGKQEERRNFTEYTFVVFELERCDWLT